MSPTQHARVSVRLQEFYWRLRVFAVLTDEYGRNGVSPPKSRRIQTENGNVKKSMNVKNLQKKKKLSCADSPAPTVIKTELKSKIFAPPLAFERYAYRN